MFGDDRVRFCSSCKLNVYNLSGMTRREAERLVYLTEGSLCVRFYRRKDGTLLTEDCPIGMRVTAPLARIAAFALAAAVPFWGTLLVVNWRDVQASIIGWFEPPPSQGKPHLPFPTMGVPPPLGRVVMPRTGNIVGELDDRPLFREPREVRSPRANGGEESRLPGRAPSDPGPSSPPIRAD